MINTTGGIIGTLGEMAQECATRAPARATKAYRPYNGGRSRGGIFTCNNMRQEDMP